jgi:hypothetical protein
VSVEAGIELTVLAQTDELSGPALEWAVARALGYPRDGWLLLELGDRVWLHRKTGSPPCEYQSKPIEYGSNWSMAGPLIDSEGIGLSKRDGVWFAEKDASTSSGASSLVAAMRCFVKMRLGPQIDLPRSLV